MFKKLLNFLAGFNPCNKGPAEFTPSTGRVFICIGRHNTESKGESLSLEDANARFTPMLDAFNSQHYLSNRGSLQGFEEDFHYVIIDLAYSDVHGIPPGLVIERLEGQLDPSYCVVSIVKLNDRDYLQEFTGTSNDPVFTSKLLDTIRWYM